MDQRDNSPAGAVHPVIDRLARRLPVAALGLRCARTPDVVRWARATGHHAVWVDLEHSAMPVDVAGALCGTAADLGLTALVRVPEREYGVVGRLLDAGASGIIFPRVETAGQAADLVAACRFPPLGHRSAIATLPCVGYRRVPAAELYATANRATLVKVLLESPLGIENAEAIASVPGVDLLAIGTNDLCAELGVPGEATHPLVREAHEAALRACLRAGKPLAIGGVADVRYVADLIARGAAPFMMTGIDSDLLAAAMRERVDLALASLETGDAARA
ncbi:aldolase/citrate lyase family protein [Pigmentiphaga sp.]|uniref:HpcH/HpaI aldolase family protein n=1 Tax=Pigmentiphaga sp. TaxID=1977564 RepID=UPI00128C3B55|nr:aldolase/citrate lyase family protein [Pigmentiphaga sp.]MPS26939.1 aldolase [Alcaligenaceae bacterium SAGV5]MPS51937.1 aldolase [Alcaligenaceae bacterium SAGV3]MPT58416.1 aldolase [Alcaligenaceae bacterium]